MLRLRENIFCGCICELTPTFSLFQIFSKMFFFFCSVPDIIFEISASVCAFWKTWRHFLEMRPQTQGFDDEMAVTVISRKTVALWLIQVMFQDSLLYFIW
jgi:hypothetical protein